MAKYVEYVNIFCTFSMKVGRVDQQKLRKDCVFNSYVNVVTRMNVIISKRNQNVHKFGCL